METFFCIKVSKKWLPQPLHQGSWLGWVENRCFLLAFWIRLKLKKSNKNPLWALKHQSNVGKGIFTDLIQRHHPHPWCDCDPPVDSMELVTWSIWFSVLQCMQNQQAARTLALYLNLCCLKKQMFSNKTWNLSDIIWIYLWLSVLDSWFRRSFCNDWFNS